jgi:hypothetical protein
VTASRSASTSATTESCLAWSNGVDGSNRSSNSLTSFAATDGCDQNASFL